VGEAETVEVLKVVGDEVVVSLPVRPSSICGMYVKPGYDNIEIGPAVGRLSGHAPPSSEVSVVADALHAVIVTALQVVEEQEVIVEPEALLVLQTTSQLLMVWAVTVQDEDDEELLSDSLELSSFSAASVSSSAIPSKAPRSPVKPPTLSVPAMIPATVPCRVPRSEAAELTKLQKMRHNPARAIPRSLPKEFESVSLVSGHIGPRDLIVLTFIGCMHRGHCGVGTR
jgi:hypothetical protein